MSEWIPVTERLPELLCDVLALRKNGSMVVAYTNQNSDCFHFERDSDCWKMLIEGKQDTEYESITIYDIVAWMPLPSIKE